MNSCFISWHPKTIPRVPSKPLIRRWGTLLVNLKITAPNVSKQSPRTRNSPRIRNAKRALPIKKKKKAGRNRIIERERGECLRMTHHWTLPPVVGPRSWRRWPAAWGSRGAGRVADPTTRASAPATGPGSSRGCPGRSCRCRRARAPAPGRRPGRTRRARSRRDWHSTPTDLRKRQRVKESRSFVRPLLNGFGFVCVCVFVVRMIDLPIVYKGAVIVPGVRSII